MCDATGCLSALEKDRAREGRICVSAASGGCGRFLMCWDRGMNEIFIGESAQSGVEEAVTPDSMGTGKRCLSCKSVCGHWEDWIVKKIPNSPEKKKSWSVGLSDYCIKALQLLDSKSVLPLNMAFFFYFTNVLKIYNLLNRFGSSLDLIQSSLLVI